jgi:hypothetical protein
MTLRRNTVTNTVIPPSRAIKIVLLKNSGAVQPPADFGSNFGLNPSVVPST